MDLRRTIPAALAVVGLGLLPSTAHAAPSDVLTEDAERVTVTVPAGDYDELEARRCAYAGADDALDVECRGSGTLWVEYEVDVPADAINLRTSVSRTFAEGTPGRYVRAQGARTGRTTYLVTVSVARGSKVRLGRVRVRYDLPSRVDDQACVTPGEWQAIHVGRGGSGGTRARVRAVFDHAGVREARSRWQGGYRYQVRAYPRCGSDRQVRITFHQYRGQPGWHSYWG